jgi:hypothetical protein
MLKKTLKLALENPFHPRANIVKIKKPLYPKPSGF